jgi:hypothetical protein
MHLINYVSAALLLVGTATASTLTPPVLPLIVRNPYLSTWLADARDAPWKHWPMFWTGESVSVLRWLKLGEYTSSHLSSDWIFDHGFGERYRPCVPVIGATTGLALELMVSSRLKIRTCHWLTLYVGQNQSTMARRTTPPPQISRTHLRIHHPRTIQLK